MKDSRRRRRLIDRRFQLTAIAKLVGLQCVVLLVAFWVIWLFADSELGTSLAQAHVSVQNVRDLLVPVMATLAVVNILLAAGITAAVVLIDSHRIAGPLYRVQQALREVESGDLTPHTQIRTEDQTRPLADQLTATVASLARDIGTAKQCLAKADAEAQAVGLTLPAEVARAKAVLERYRID